MNEADTFLHKNKIYIRKGYRTRPYMWTTGVISGALLGYITGPIISPIHLGYNLFNEMFEK